VTALAFELPPALEATEPPEARGRSRDDVRLLVGWRHDGAIRHLGFGDLLTLLNPGDLLVINASATLPAAVAGRRPDRSATRVHFSTRAPQLDPSWRVVELRSADGARPARGRSGEQIELEGGARIQLVAPYASGARLMLARFEGDRSVEAYLQRAGEPIHYGHARRHWPMESYQNVYATEPGSAEMASAGRPFTTSLIAQLRTRGVLIATVTLHAGVSSPECHEPPFPEQFEVPEATARLVRAVRGHGGRVVAVGTTVVRALETVARREGTVRAGSGWTGLVIEPPRGLRIVDGLITGWHEPAASHLRLVAAVAGESLLERCYREALTAGYLWHEFGDSHLILP
jgi:S-adenosylmethionine:tRNA ribosyltransferase-isomerase